MNHNGEYRPNRSSFLITQPGQRSNKPTTHQPSRPTMHQYFYRGQVTLGINPLQVAKDLESDGRHLAAGMEYARQGKITDAKRGVKACMAVGRTADAATIYLAAGMPREAIECTLECTGDDAFRAAKLFLEHSETEAAHECAKRYLEGKDAATICKDEKKILFRIFCRAGDETMANQFIV